MCRCVGVYVCVCALRRKGRGLHVVGGVGVEKRTACAGFDVFVCRRLLDCLFITIIVYYLLLTYKRCPYDGMCFWCAELGKCSCH